MLLLARLAAIAAGKTSRLLGRGGGTSLPGLVLLRLRPEAIGELADQITRGSVTISATNGKTTTARLVSSGVHAAGLTSVANRAGANLLGGIAASLLDVPSTTPRPQIGIFEVDEAALPDIADRLQPQTMTLMNLFRDQLDRFGELDTLVDRWHDMLQASAPTTLVLNADDPAVAWLGSEASHHRIVWFGVDAADQMGTELSHAADSTTCRRCNAELHYSGVTLGHFGHWRCTNCDNQRPAPQVSVRSVAANGLDSQHLVIGTPAGDLSVDFGLPGLHNAYNAAAAVATLLALDVGSDHIEQGLGAAEAAFGRAEKVTVDDHDLWLLLAKNPTGTNENIRTVLTDDQPLHVLAMLNDRTADGRDVSWIWDVDWEPLLDRLSSITVAGDRAHDLALRFRYAGIDPDVMTVVPEPAAALDAALGAARPGGPVYVLPTYTAMLDLRSVLTDRGLTEAYWDEP